MSSREGTSSNKLSDNPEPESTEESRLWEIPGMIARAANRAVGRAVCIG